MSFTSYRTLGRSGLRVSPLAFGAMNFDDGSWGSGPEASFALLDHYLDAGGNFVDTANMYNKGASEETLGRYFAQRPGRRDRVVLATKFGGSMAADDPNSGGARHRAGAERTPQEWNTPCPRRSKSPRSAPPRAAPPMTSSRRTPISTPI